MPWLSPVLSHCPPCFVSSQGDRRLPFSFLHCDTSTMPHGSLADKPEMGRDGSQGSSFLPVSRPVYSETLGKGSEGVRENIGNLLLYVEYNTIQYNTSMTCDTATAG